MSKSSCEPHSPDRLVAVSIGSNIGDRLGNLARAVKALARLDSNAVVSSVYETAPMYEIDQAKFLNAIVVFTSKLEASELLDVFKVTEAEIGRKKRLANGPREIDLDLVWIDGYQSPLGAVPIVPHPRAHERKFVLEPLNEILPGIVLQGYGKVERLLMSEDLQGQSVDKVEDASILLSSG